MVDPHPDDSLRGEAQARDEATLMPWLWGAVGLLVIAVFVAWMLFGGGHRIREPAGAAPATRSISQRY
jgi:hypothetical protein